MRTANIVVSPATTYGALLSAWYDRVGQQLARANGLVFLNGGSVSYYYTIFLGSVADEAMGVPAEQSFELTFSPGLRGLTISITENIARNIVETVVVRWDVLMAKSCNQIVSFLHQKFHHVLVAIVAPAEPAQAKTASRSLSDIADDVYRDWKPINYAAKPYLEAMSSMNSITDDYGQDSGHMIVAYFLGNASTWRGPVAKQIKLELNQMLKQGRRASSSMTASDAKLRSGLIRLAHASSGADRKAILAVLKEAGVSQRAGKTGAGDSEPWDAAAPDTRGLPVPNLCQVFSDRAKVGDNAVYADAFGRESNIILTHKAKDGPQGEQLFYYKNLGRKTAGCEKLPNQGMIDNCEKKKEEGKKNDDKDADKKATVSKRAGYTHYWKTKTVIDTESWDKIVAVAKQIVAKAQASGIVVGDENGTGNPQFTNHWIALNGDAKANLDLESFVFMRANADTFTFCKTARKPYDAVVVSILAAARKIVGPKVLSVSSDGGPSAIKRIF